MDPVIALVKEQAEQAIMFQNSSGTMLRINHCDEDSFTCMDENRLTKNEFTIKYDQVDLATESFYKLTKI